VRSLSAPRGEIEATFEKRAARAFALARESQTAAEPLRFATGLYRAQGRLAATILGSHAQSALSGRLEHDADRVLESAGDLLRYIAEQAPGNMAEEARARGQQDRSSLRSILLAFWSADPSSFEDYLSRAMLRPYVEVLARLGIVPDRPHRRGGCPFCGGGPWISARRSEGAMDGSRRLLGCALCGGEWPLNRIYCPACAEEDPARLPSFQSDAYRSVRIEACETCHRYVKSIDLADDARPIPEVDDLASISMDLWAAEQGWTRIEQGLAGL
jgi:formate dehydrogenase maturation protein FdhE